MAVFYYAHRMDWYSLPIAGRTQSSQQREAIAQREADEALTAIARTFAVSHTTISRL
jgi:hypothetical protein